MIDDWIEIPMGGTNFDIPMVEAYKRAIRNVDDDMVSQYD
jgi:hypothetical protein